jgi:putative MATE family efflux protein
MASENPGRPDAVFTHGSTMGHVLRMTATGSIGLMAIFAVDFLSLLYISWLGDEKLTAAVGYASLLLFLLTSVNIGFMIAVTALVARRLGGGDARGARVFAGSGLALMALLAAVLWLLAAFSLSPLLDLLGATGEVKTAAARYLQITLPSNILMALGMGYSGVLRAVGDANRAMYVTLAGGIFTAVVDPLLIFVMGLGIDGAAICVVLSRAVFALVGWHGAVKVHAMVSKPDLRQARTDFRAIVGIAGPAILTNVATPVSGAMVTRIVSDFGAWAVAANAVMDRLVPISFGALFALSASIGPILAQNLGAGQYARMRAALRDAFLFCGAYVVVIWLALILLRVQIAGVFNLSGPAAEGIVLFCLLSGPMWFFIGLVLTANAAFNNLGFPLYSTAFNWGRAIIGGVIPALIGSRLGGYPGVLIGLTVGAIGFGILAVIFSFRTIATLERRGKASVHTAVAPEPARP